MKIAAIFYSICLLANPLVAYAQQPPLAATGQVVGPNGQPEPGVALRVEGQKSVVVLTDNNGYWALYNLPVGQYTIQPVTGSSQRQTFAVTQQGQPVRVGQIVLQH
jgi:hypothetical protein